MLAMCLALAACSRLKAIASHFHGGSPQLDYPAGLTVSFFDILVIPRVG